MRAKLQSLKTKRHKTTDRRQLVGKLAELSGASVRYVNYILFEREPKRSRLAEKILMAARILNSGYEAAETEAAALFTDNNAAA